MAFKQNLPVFIGLALLCLGLVALALYFQKPEEEVLREAASVHAATLGPVKEVRVRGTVVDIDFPAKPTLYAEFEKREGRWVFKRDLGQAFETMMKEPSTIEGILKNLAQRIADRLAMSVNIKDPNLAYQFQVSRVSEDLLGQVFVHFAYPKQGDQQRLGTYREVFRWKEGAWKSDGPGALFDRLPKSRP